ncbi:PE-PPE domain-containing protein [Mycobacterium sp. 141]|uniref:PE-PPE domain-containing protein n=1 Tax=Mycobacterium sp. 141 TaxID=1120797 RepID=UPI0003A0322A|nr:PE-PPE domain-containing protein [Mycobacterium sp. 141]
MAADAALIMGGTGHPLSPPQDSPQFIDSCTDNATNNYIVLTGYCGPESCTPTAVSTPEQFMPVSGTMPFDESVAQGTANLNQAITVQSAGTQIVVFGYLQSARIASIKKRNLARAGSRSGGAGCADARAGGIGLRPDRELRRDRCQLHRCDPDRD